jgi:hypothetical protein
MSLQQWLDNSWITRIKPSSEEVVSLLEIARREIGDGSVEGLSPDGRFTHAYNAARILCEVALNAEGYNVPKGSREHERTIESLRFTLGGDLGVQVDYFDRCRRQRHQSLYERSGVSREKDANDLLDAARKLDVAVREWLNRQHPDLVTEEPS